MTKRNYSVRRVSMAGRALLNSMRNRAVPNATTDGAKDPKESLATKKAILQILLFHLGLIFMCAVYIIIGACIFYYLEHPIEIAEREKGLERVEKSKKLLLDRLWDLSQNITALEAVSKQTALEYLDEHVLVLFEEFDNSNMAPAFEILGRQNAAIEDRWSFKSAIMLAVTTVTTVGYGYLTPKTVAGRIFCIVYGMIGIPLTLVTLADLARFLGVAVLTLLYKLTLYYQRIKPYLRRSKHRCHGNTTKLNSFETMQKVPLSMILLILIIYPLVGGMLFPIYRHDWSFLDAVYYSLTSILTIGYGDLTLGSQLDSFIVLILYLIIGIVIVTMCVDLVGGQWIEQIHFFGHQVQKAKDVAQRMKGMYRNLHNGLGVGLSQWGNNLNRKGNSMQPIREEVLHTVTGSKGAFEPRGFFPFVDEHQRSKAYRLLGRNDSTEIT